ncbi:MAG: hypothetical protein RL033_3727 [Pseudomonadota bacterium]
MLALTRGASASPGLTLETGSPDALCPALPTAREAVERRLGTLVVSSGAGWRARYTIAHAPEGAQMDFVRLELFAPDGALQLSRDLPLEAGACSTVAEAIALVLDRYFRKLPLGDVPPGDVSLRDAPTGHAPPGDGAAAERAPAEETATGGAQAGLAPAPVLPNVGMPPAAPQSPAASISDVPPSVAEPGTGTKDASSTFWRVGAALATSTTTGPAVGLQALRESWPHLYTGAELALDWSAGSQRWLDGVEVNARSLSGALTVGWGTRWGALRGYVGPTVRLSLEHATARGLAQSLERDRARVSAGLLLGLVAGLTRHWSLSLTTGLEASLGAGQFLIDGQEVLRPELMEGRLTLGVGYSSDR